MTCYNSTLADVYAHQTGLADVLEAQKQRYADDEAESVITSSFDSYEYQNVLLEIADNEEHFTAKDKLVHKMINTTDVNKLLELQKQLRELHKNVASDIVYNAL